MVLGFGKDKDDRGGDAGGQVASNGSSPTEEVETLASQGYSEHEIIEELRERGYRNQDIQRSINKVLKERVSSDQGQAQQSARSQRGRGRGQEDDRFIAPSPSQVSSGRSQDPADDPFAPFVEEKKSSGGQMWDMTEEEVIEMEMLVEEIVEEKWMEIESEISSFLEEGDKLREDVRGLEMEIDDLFDIQTEAEDKLEERIKETSSELKTLKSRVNSLEKAFKQFLPEIAKKARSLDTNKNIEVEDDEGSSELDSDRAKLPGLDDE